MISAFLGKLGKGEWGRVTLHTQSLDEDSLLSYTFWVPSGILSGPMNVRGITVSAEIASHFLPIVENIWVCENYEVIDTIRF